MTANRQPLRFFRMGNGAARLAAQPTREVGLEAEFIRRIQKCASMDAMR